MTVSGDLLTACERAFLEVKGLREYRGVSEKLVKDYESRLSILEKQVDKQARVIEGQDSELAEVRKALDSEKAALKEAKMSLALCRTEVVLLRRERDSARRWIWKAGLIGAVAGALAAVFLGGSR